MKPESCIHPVAALTILVTVFALFARSAHAAAVTSTWKVGSGVWSASTNWTNAPFLGGSPNNGNAGVATYDAVVPSGTVTLDTNIVIQKFTQSGGTVGGSFNLTANELHTWKAGTLSGAGTNFDAGGLAATGTVFLSGRRLEPMMSATLAGGSLHMGSGAVLTNKSGITFSILDDSSVFNDGGLTAPAFLNSGRLSKSGSGNGVSGVGAGVSRIDVPFTNNGMVVAESGTLRFTSSYVQTAGFTVLTGGVISASVPLDIRGGSVIGSGTIVATVTNNGAVAPGFSPGLIEIIGNLISLPNATTSFELAGTNAVTGYDVMRISGTAALGGALQVSTIGGFQISSNATFVLLKATNGISGAFSNAPPGARLAVFNSGGTMKVNYGPGSPYPTNCVVVGEFQLSLAPVMADFSASPTNGTSPLTVMFGNLTTGSATNYLWNFGDGTVSGAVNPSHTYTNAGAYTVSLTASGPGGTNTNTKTSLITVASVPPPVAEFSANSTTGTAPLMVSFANQTSGTATNYFWNFGDNSSSTAANPTHPYTNAGTYTVSLTASGPGGTNTNTKVNYIFVAAPPPVCVTPPSVPTASPGIFWYAIRKLAVISSTGSAAAVAQAPSTNNRLRTTRASARSSA